MPAAKPTTTRAAPATNPKTPVAAKRQPAKSAKAKATQRGNPAPMAKSNGPDKAEPIPLATEKPAKKPKKTKVIRDSFTMPETDYAKLAELKKKCLTAGVSVKKSELLRAGLHMLEALPVAKLKIAVGALDSVKTGRPPADKAEKKRQAS